VSLPDAYHRDAADLTPDQLAASEHPAVRDYVAARRRGDTDTTSRIVDEVRARFATRTTDGSEAAQIMRASMTIPFGGAA
jgi:hypothetical protein